MAKALILREVDSNSQHVRRVEWTSRRFGVQGWLLTGKCNTLSTSTSKLARHFSASEFHPTDQSRAGGRERQISRWKLVYYRGVAKTNNRTASRPSPPTPLADSPAPDLPEVRLDDWRS